MLNCKSKVIQDFFKILVKELKQENAYRNNHCLKYKEDNKERLDIPFIIAPLWQELNKEYSSNLPECKYYEEFKYDLEKHSNYSVNVLPTPEDDYYTYCKISVDLYDEDVKYAYSYEFEFTYDQRYYGYCMCTPDMEDYREDKCCCGHGCDWDAPSFTMKQVQYICRKSWNGDEHSYWDFEDEFYKNDREEKER